MRIRTWNAYAANNSGSYTIVGLLPSEEVAAALAEKLRDVIERHTAWLESHGAVDGRSSPLEDYCRAEGLTWAPGRGDGDEWPQYDGPSVVAVGRQLVVHHPHTITLPPTFGEAIDAAGGRVQREEDHAHHPIVTIARFWWGWTDEDRRRLAEQRPLLVDALWLGPLAPPPRKWPPAVRVSDVAFEAPLTVGAIFRDVVAFAVELRALAVRHGASLELHLAEAPDGEHDPLAHLRD
jgi:hypothetical protein